MALTRCVILWPLETVQPDHRFFFLLTTPACLGKMRFIPNKPTVRVQISTLFTVSHLLHTPRKKYATWHFWSVGTNLQARLHWIGQLLIRAVKLFIPGLVKPLISVCLFISNLPRVRPTVVTGPSQTGWRKVCQNGRVARCICQRKPSTSSLNPSAFQPSTSPELCGVDVLTGHLYTTMPLYYFQLSVLFGSFGVVCLCGDA